MILLLIDKSAVESGEIEAFIGDDMEAKSSQFTTRLVEEWGPVLYNKNIFN